MWPIKLPTWVYPAIAGAVILAVLLTLAFCSGKDVEKGEQATKTVAIQKQVSKADAGAADLRVEDKARIVRQNEELTDAYQNATSPDARRRARGCAILRQQSADGRVPAACGPEGR